MRNYTTAQGDMWDSISRRVYNSESMMHLLIDANLGYRDVVVFPANCELMVPDAPRVTRVTFPPWRANA